jgi:hypothetical protein
VYFKDYAFPVLFSEFLSRRLLGDAYQVRYLSGFKYLRLVLNYDFGLVWKWEGLRLIFNPSRPRHI